MRIEQFNHLEPERWAQWAADWLDDNIESSIPRNVLVEKREAFFDTWFVSFDAEEALKAKDFNALCNLYMLPGIMSMRRGIDCIAPYANELIFRPTRLVGVEWTRTAVSNNKSLVCSGAFLAGGGGKYGIVLAADLGFSLKTPVVDQQDFRRQINLLLEPMKEV